MVANLLDVLLCFSTPFGWNTGAAGFIVVNKGGKSSLLSTDMFRERVGVRAKSIMLQPH